MADWIKPQCKHCMFICVHNGRTLPEEIKNASGKWDHVPDEFINDFYFFCSCSDMNYVPFDCPLVHDEDECPHYEEDEGVCGNPDNKRVFCDFGIEREDCPRNPKRLVNNGN